MVSDNHAVVVELNYDVWFSPAMTCFLPVFRKRPDPRNRDCPPAFSRVWRGGWSFYCIWYAFHSLWESHSLKSMGNQSFQSVDWSNRLFTCSILKREVSIYIESWIKEGGGNSFSYTHILCFHLWIHFSTRYGHILESSYAWRLYQPF